MKKKISILPCERNNLVNFFKCCNHVGIFSLMILLFFPIIINSCNKDNSSLIGTNYQGGKIAYILQPGDPGYDENVQHGLIAAPTDQSTGILWWNGNYTVTGAIGTGYGTGSTNTNTIVDRQGTGNYAAKLCYDLVIGGYSDWYLPSISELNKLFLNKAEIGGFTGNAYWSSSEFDSYFALQLNFANGIQDKGSKGSASLCVRAVRNF